MYKALSIGFAVGLMMMGVGCTDLHVERDGSFNVYAADSLSAEYKTELASALNEWSAASEGSVTFALRFVPDASLPTTPNVWAKEATIYVLNRAPDSEGHAGFTFGAQNSDVFIHLRSVYEGKLVHRLLLHEVGHAIGLNDASADAEDTIMYPRLGDSMPDYITCNDKQNLCQSWGCNPSCQ